LDEAEEVAHAVAGDPERIPEWMCFHGPARAAVQRGIAYVEAGRAADAVEVLAEAIGRTRPEEVRDRGWNHGRLALAHAMNGAVEAAVASARAAVAIAARSPHTAADLRTAARLLHARAPRHAAELPAMAQGWRRRDGVGPGAGGPGSWWVGGGVVIRGRGGVGVWRVVAALAVVVAR
jgi:hypothetical protein